MGGTAPPDSFLGFTPASDNVYFYKPPAQDHDEHAPTTDSNQFQPPGYVDNIVMHLNLILNRIE